MVPLVCPSHYNCLDHETILKLLTFMISVTVGLGLMWRLS